MKIELNYGKYFFLRVSTDEKSEFLKIDIVLFSFSYKGNLTVQDGRLFTEACHGVGIWQKPNLGISLRDITPGFLVLFNGFARSKVKNLLSWFSIITQVIIEILALSLAENGVIFRYNHLRRGDYSGSTNFQNSRLAFCKYI